MNVVYIDGNIYIDGKLKKLCLRKEKKKSYYYINHNNKRYLAASLIAKKYLPKSKFNNLIFKDRNTLNINPDNLMWLDNNNYHTYCKLHIFTGKIIGCHLKAAIKTKNILLKQYYFTKNELYLYHCWSNIVESLSHNFDNVLDEMYLYFMDRARRFSIIGDPKGILILYGKGVISKKVQFIDNFHSSK